MLALYIALVAVVIFCIVLFVSSYVKAGPDEAILITGAGKRKVLIGRAGFRIPFFQRTDRLSLKVFQVDIKTTEAIPTKEFINIFVDGVANLKISSNPDLLNRAFESVLKLDQEELAGQLQEILQGNMREIIGTVAIKQLVQDRQAVAEQVKENVVPDMEKIGVELVNFNIQSFSDRNDVIENLGIDNIAQISKEAQIAKANADKEVAIAKAQALQAANEAKVESETKIAEQDTMLSLKKSELKQKSDTAQATADAAYEIEEGRRKQEINIAVVNASIAQKEREVELGNKQVELEERRLQATVNKKADAEKYAAEQKAQADLFARQKAAEAEKFELTQKAEIQKIQAEAARVAKEKEAAAVKILAEANRDAAIAEAEGIRAKGEAEAEAILKKADAMKQYGDAATLQLILDSEVLPKVVEAYSKPMAAAMGQIDKITMYGEGNTAKLNEEIEKNGAQIISGLKNTLGLDLKSVLAGYLGGKLGQKEKE